MSTGLELIPLALAVGAAVRAARRSHPEAGSQDHQFETRLKDGVIALQALQAHDPVATSQGGAIRGLVGQVPVTLLQSGPGQPLLATVHGSVGRDQAEGALRAIDSTYVGIVQEAVRARILEQAPNNGMTLEQEVREDDDSLVLTLRVDQP